MRNIYESASPLSGDLPDVLGRYADVVDTALRAAVPLDPVPLYESLRYHMGWADEGGTPLVGGIGKRLRPALCLMVCEAVGGQLQEALPAAVAVELVHNFSLVHDDIQDHDRERHSRPTVWALWGEPQALNVGDTLYSLGCKTILDQAQHRVVKERSVQAAARLTQSVLEMVEGQYLDLEFEKRLDVTTQEYFDMSMRKTGALIVCATELGALIGSGDLATVSILAKSGRYIGQLFQLRDDVLGIWGDTAITGKAVNNDIWRKKKTFPVLHALQHANGAAAAAMQRLYRKARLSEKEVLQVLEVLESTGARKKAETLAVRLADQALDSLRPAELSPERTRDFEELVSFLVVRGR